MSIKSIIQIFIIIIILIILGSVYSQYFAKNKVLVEETTNIKNENDELYKDLEKKINELEKKNNKLMQEIEIKIDELNKKELEEKIKNDEVLKSKKEIEEKEKLFDAEKKLEEEKKLLEEKEKLLEAEKKLEEEKKLIIEEKKILKEEQESGSKNNKVSNTLKDVEYISTDRKGNRFRLLATSAKSNKDDNNFLDLNNVRGVITSDIRDPIYIVSDFGQYNTINFNSKFYENVIINYMEKQITCENFDIDMETNMAIAYNNVIVTDPNSTMKAGIITFDLETKDVNINPVLDEKKVKVTKN